MSGPAAPVLTAEGFFSRSWAAQGEVRTVLGRTLRRFRVEARSRWSQDEQGYVVDERATYEGGGELQRSWHLTVDRDGSMMGLEASQGGRTVVRNTAAGVRARYDRLRFLPGPNVASLTLDLRLQPDGSVRGSGVTRLLGLPLIRTELVFTPLAPGATA
jgi:hypothetical protein